MLKVHAVVARSTLSKTLHDFHDSSCSEHFWMWHEARFQIKMLKVRKVRSDPLDVQPSCLWQAQWILMDSDGFCAFKKVSETGGFRDTLENGGRRGMFEQICIPRGRCQYKRHLHQTCSEVRALIPERGCILEHQTVRFAQIIFHDRCSTLYDWASLFPSGRTTLETWDGKSQNAFVRGRHLCT